MYMKRQHLRKFWGAQNDRIVNVGKFCSRSQWLRGLRRRSAAARLLESWVRIKPGAWMLVCCECCVLSGRGLCYELITRPEESYRLWCVVVCDLENFKNEEAMTRVGSQRHSKKKRKILEKFRYKWGPYGRGAGGEAEETLCKK